MVRPVFEHSSVMWPPYTKKNNSAVESVQRRAARFVTNTYNQMSRGSLE